jgi:hypothetical protein
VIEFSVGDVPSKVDGQWRVVGRCLTDTYLGARFTKIAPFSTTKSDLTNFVYVYDEEDPVDLVVRRIHAYGKDLRVWSVGMSAEIFLSGGGDNLSIDGILRSEAGDELPSEMARIIKEGTAAEWFDQA